LLFAERRAEIQDAAWGATRRNAKLHREVEPERRRERLAAAIMDGLCAARAPLCE